MSTTFVDHQVDGAGIVESAAFMVGEPGNHCSWGESAKVGRRAFSARIRQLTW